MAVTVGTLRELFRNVEAFRAFYESDGVEEITAPDGTVWSLWDVEYLLTQTALLSPRQRQAIDLCLVKNVLEREAAKMMGVSETNPVASYATNGLKKIVEMIDQGMLPRFRDEEAA